MTEVALNQEEAKNQEETKKQVVDSLGRARATGRRKTSSARVWIKPGNGKIIINKKDMDEYFGRPVLSMIVNNVFQATDTLGKFDVYCTVSGGGLSGQAGAILHGIARSLDNFDPSLHKTLRQGGFLTRDSRKVERKKPGRPKARKSFQFSKR